MPHEELLRALETAAGARERVHTFDLRVRQYLYFCASKASKLSTQARVSALHTFDLRVCARFVTQFTCFNQFTCFTPRASAAASKANKLLVRQVN